MKKIFNLASAIVLLLATTASAFAATAWPAPDVTEIGSSVRSVVSNVEPSGLAWHSGRGQIFMVGDEGQLFAFNTDGSNVAMWNIGGDLEGVTVVDPNSSYVYLADENGKILKYDLSTSATVQSWDVTGLMPKLTCPGGVGTCGMEALTYADGYFYAGYQYNGKIYVLDLSGTTAVQVKELSGLSGSGYWDLSDLSYRDGYLYALYSDTLAIMNLEGTVETMYSVPGSDQEGLVLGLDSNEDGDANMFIAEDHGGVTGWVYSYNNFPIYGWTPKVTDPDNDGDGIVASLDCNDSDATVSTMQTYYIDKDNDGLGSVKSSTSVCSSSVPVGYANNTKDVNDSIPNAGIEIGGDKVDNDGDGKIDEANTLAENGLHPYYSTLNPDESSTGKIKKVWGLTRGSFGVSFKDGSRYRYYILSSKTKEVSTVSLISGTAYVSVTIEGVTYIVNAYTGEIMD